MSSPVPDTSSTAATATTGSATPLSLFADRLIKELEKNYSLSTSEIEANEKTVVRINNSLAEVGTISLEEDKNEKKERR